jgi:hypothetical protein
MVLIDDRDSGAREALDHVPKRTSGTNILSDPSRTVRGEGMGRQRWRGRWRTTRPEAVGASDDQFPWPIPTLL